MTAPGFDPRARVEALGERALRAVETAAAGVPWTFHVLYAAADNLHAAGFSRLAKRLHDLGAVWAVNHREVRP